VNIENFSTVNSYSLADTLPDQCREGTWVGRAWLPESSTADGIAGPCVIQVRSGQVYELSARYLTMADLFAEDKPVLSLNTTAGRPVCTLDELLDNTLFHRRPEDYRHTAVPFLLAPNDIQATKACGVTFIRSLLERVIEEQAQGDPGLAAEIRGHIQATIGNNLTDIVPGSAETEALKRRLIEQGVWSQYLEVGIGKDAEIFTKAQPMSSITSGFQIGILRSSEWNNPEPEIVVAANARGDLIGATLGNDVNLRDYEGRSALLLGKAKDQNGSSSIGPLLRLFDETFSLADIQDCEVTLAITGEDGFASSGANLMSEISRSPQQLTNDIINRNHQYPDGMMLYLGTMFAPTEDRASERSGFTHKVGDRVEISTPKLGTLVNWVNYCDDIPEWSYGVHELIHYLRQKR